MSINRTPLHASMTGLKEQLRRIKIGALNDALRATGKGGHLMATYKVRRLDPADLARVMTAVQDFNDFNDDNDPWGEHDFGAFDLDIEGEKQKFFWKIDYYDKQLNYHSEDKADAAVTTRVLTVMMASEY